MFSAEAVSNLAFGSRGSLLLASLISSISPYIWQIMCRTRESATLSEKRAKLTHNTLII